jgi:hypothetical protein
MKTAESNGRAKTRDVREENRELLMGTWIGVALIVELLIAEGILDRENLLLLLGQFEAAAPGWRKTALAGLRAFIERGFSIEV